VSEESRTDMARIADCIRRVREMGLKVCIGDSIGDRWEQVVGELPLRREPGMYTEGEELRYYDNDGALAGICIERAGEFTVIVKPSHRGRGIGTKLLEEAVRRWDIDFKAQRYTISGAELVMKFLKWHRPS
jgi:GNAT superfamily N-acetyltransferase